MIKKQKSSAPLLVSIALAAAVLAMGCGRAASPQSRSAAPQTPAAQSKATPRAPAAQGRTPGADESQTSAACPNGSLANCFSYADMGAFVQTVAPMVGKFFEAQYPELPQPRNIVYVPHGQIKPGACTGTSQSYEYCPGNDSIYLGQDLLWQFYRIGDAAPVVGLAHEWGHHVQTLERLPDPRTASQSVDFENQADCIAGSWTKYAGEQKWLEYPKDLNDIGTLLVDIGSREGPGRDHGTASERTKAFQSGYKNGLSACNSYSAEAAPVYAG